MRRGSLLLAGALLVASAVLADDVKPAAAPMHTVIAASDVAWGPAPPGLPPGSKAAVLSGNPGIEGSYTLRAWLPNGYKVPPHWHPTTENLTVLSGTLHVGMGDVFDKAKGTTITAGGFAVMPATMRHWAWAEGEVVMQVHGNGPFSITYVNPADDPRTMAPTKP